MCLYVCLQVFESPEKLYLVLELATGGDLCLCVCLQVFESPEKLYLVLELATGGDLCLYVCLQVFESPEKLYLVLELATGGDLFDQIQARGVFTERDGARVLRMVLDGVRYLHGVGVTHHDLKPDNVHYYQPGADSKVMVKLDNLLSRCLLQIG